MIQLPHWALRKKTCGKISFQITKPGSGEQFLSPACKAKAGFTAMLFADAETHAYRHVIRHRCLSMKMPVQAGVCMSAANVEVGVRMGSFRQLANVQAANVHSPESMAYYYYCYYCYDY